MTSTLVLGHARNDVARQARALLRGTANVTHVLCSPGSPGVLHADSPAGVAGAAVLAPRWPQTWETVTTCDLTRALLASRQPVLIDDIVRWLQGQVGSDGLQQPEIAIAQVDALLDELAVTLRALPFDVVVITHESLSSSSSSLPSHPEDGGAHALLSGVLEHVNRRLSAVCEQVQLVTAGRVLDLSQARPVGG